MISPFKMSVEELSNYVILKNKKLKGLMEKKLELELELAILGKKEELKFRKMPPTEPVKKTKEYKDKF